MKTSLDPKSCSACGRVLPRSAFHGNGRGRVAGRCKECTNAHKRAQYARDPSLRCWSNRQWKLRHPEKVAASRRRYAQTHRAEQRAYQQEYSQTARKERQDAQQARQQQEGNNAGGAGGPPPPTLTPRQGETLVQHIHAAAAAGESRRALAARLGVHQSTISRILTGKTRRPRGGLE